VQGEGGFTARLRRLEVVALKDGQVLHEGRAATWPGPPQPPGPHRCTDSGPGRRFGALAPFSLLWITALQSPGPPAGSSPCPLGVGGAPTRLQGPIGNLAKGGLVCTRCRGPNLARVVACLQGSLRIL